MKQAILLVFVLAVFLFGCAEKKVTISEPTPVDDSSSVNENEQIPPLPSRDGNEIIIQNFAFKPDVIKIKKGESITWINKDSVKHTATADDGSFDSGLLGKDQAWSFTFNNAGTYGYYCIPHPRMTATVMVEE